MGVFIGVARLAQLQQEFRDRVQGKALTEALAAFTGYLESLDASQSPSGRRTHDFRVVSLSYNSPAEIVAVAEPRENYKEPFGPTGATGDIPRTVHGKRGQHWTVVVR